MRYYTIQENDSILIADNQQALSRFYDTQIYELPEDYEEGKYIVGEVEEEIEVPDYDEETGEQTGTHTEIITVKKLILNPNWEEEQYIRREREFNKAFFNTSLGYIRRAVTMADGSKKDFLSDLVLSIKAGLEQGLDVKILTYDKPPFDRNVEDWTIYQHTVSATPQFIMECLTQTANDFLPINEEE